MDLSANITAEVASDVIRTCYKLKYSEDFQSAMDSIIVDIRNICDASTCSILLTDFSKRKCAVLTEDVKKGSGLLPVRHYVDDSFFDIVDTWPAALDGRPYLILNSEEDMLMLDQRSPIWAASLRGANVTSFVFFPLMSGNIFIGFIWATNYDTSRAQHIRETLELTTLFLSAEIANQQLLDRLRYKMEHDEVLDIWNRHFMDRYLKENLGGKDVYSLVIADIDGFKGVNATYGHDVADELLAHYAKALVRLSKRRGWHVSRYGGDEFLVLIPGETMDQEREAIWEIQEVFTEKVPIGDEKLGLSASLGISNSDGATPAEELVIRAETAMYEAKQRGSGNVFIFTEELKERTREENHIKDKVLEALDNDGFYMLYQPQVDTQTLEVTGYEALVRMKEAGIYPGQFIPVAESNGWIWRIGRITTELVVKQLAAWKAAGKQLKPVSINFSSNQLNDAGYVSFLERLLKEYDIEAKYVEIEITEGIFLDKSQQAEELFRRFHGMGIKLLMDDFGTGYSSLGYLTYIPVDVIKLDKSLVDAYLVDGKDAFIADLIKLLHGLNKTMIIEGVEERAQYEKLKDFGAEVIQGYYFSKPISAEEAIGFKASVR